MDPRTGQILTLPGGQHARRRSARRCPSTGNPLNGVRQAGDGIADTGYTWPTIVLGPRFGVAYDVSGNQTTVIRAGGGLFYDRPDGNTVFSIPGNPPIATSADLRNGQLQTVGTGPQPAAGPAAGDLPVRGEGAGAVAVAGGRAARAAVGDGHRPVLRRQPWLQPARRTSGWLDGQPERGRLRRGLSAAEPEHDDREPQHRAGRQRLQHQPAASRIAASPTSTRTPPSSGTPTTRSRRRSTAASATGSRSVPTTPTGSRSRATPACSGVCSTTRTAASSSAPIRPSTRS